MTEPEPGAGRVCIVTGAASGIGAATVRRFARDGHPVGLIDRDVEGLAAVADGLEGPSACAVADVAEEAEVARAVAGIAEWLGEPTVLVTCAAVSGAGALATLSMDAWDRTMAVNARGPFVCARAMLPYFERGGGAIVTIASVAAFVAGAGRVAYSASKGAVVALTKGLAVELAPYGVRVNSVCPGTVDTPMAHSGMVLRGDGDFGEGLRRTGALHLVGHVASPDEIAAVVAFLCGGDASFLTGAVIMADGGLLSQMPMAMSPEPR